jgi:hypothetical protein
MTAIADQTPDAFGGYSGTALPGRFRAWSGCLDSVQPKRRMRCAACTRKSTDEGPDQEYNSIDAQRDAGHACIASQRAEGWFPVAGSIRKPPLQPPGCVRF